MMTGEVVLMMTMTVGEEGVAPLQDVVVLFQMEKIGKRQCCQKIEERQRRYAGSR